MLVAENTKLMPGIKRGSDYFFHAKKLLELSSLNYQFDKEIYEKKIDGVSFDVMEVSGSAINTVINQIYFSTVKKGFCLSFVITYGSEEQKTKLYSLVEGMKFSE